MKMDLTEIGGEGVTVDQNHEAKDIARLLALVNAIMNVRVPKNVENILTR
jgi:hypothetical protein